MDDLKITDAHIKKYNDLKIQAMLFDMDIDIETWSLVPKNNYKIPAWMTRYRESIEGTAADPEQNWEEEDER